MSDLNYAGARGKGTIDVGVLVQTFQSIIF
jgi:hypothetical protein